MSGTQEFDFSVDLMRSILWQYEGAPRAVALARASTPSAAVSTARPTPCSIAIATSRLTSLSSASSRRSLRLKGQRGNW